MPSGEGEAQLWAITEALRTATVHLELESEAMMAAKVEQLIFTLLPDIKKDFILLPADRRAKTETTMNFWAPSTTAVWRNWTSMSNFCEAIACSDAGSNTSNVT